MKRYSKKAVSLLLILAVMVAQMVVAVVPAAAAEVTTPSSSEGQTVYFKLPQEWLGRVDANTGETILPGVYVAGGTHGEHTPWVGEHMQLVDGTTDIYSYVIPEDQSKIIFNTGMQRDWQTGNLAITGGDMLFVIDKDIETKNAIGHWEPYNTSAPKVAINSGDFNFVGKKELTLSRFNSVSGTYKIDNGEEIPFESGDTITFGENVTPDTDITLTVTADNGTEKTSYTYLFHKLTSIVVYAQNKAGWEHMFVHYWGGESESVWPGIEMTPYQDSEDVWYAELPSKTTNYKFDNGDAIYSDASNELQTSNLATQSIVAGISDCYVINPLASGEAVNTGEYTSLEKAVSGSIEEGKPVISVENAIADLGSKANVNIKLQNIPQMSAYVISVTYDSSAIVPDLSALPEDVTGNVADGKLYLVYSSATPADFTEESLLISVPFDVVATSSGQAKVTAKPEQMFADEETRISFPSSNVLAGKIMLGIDRTELKSLLDIAAALDSNSYTALSYQAVEAAAASAQTVYDTVTSTQEMIDEQVASLKSAIDGLTAESDDGNYFYFKNTVGWENVYCYWWGGTTACPAFPGIKISLAPASTDVYRVDLPRDATGLNFSDGSTEDGNKFQTNSLSGADIKNNNMFVPDPSITTEKNNGIRYGGTFETYSPKRYYFKNTVGWENVYAYWWGGTTACPAFPGVKVSLVNGSADVYYVDLPIDATGLNFNDGSNEDGNKFQTNSISGASLTDFNMFVPDPSITTEKNNGIRYGGTTENYAQRKIYFVNKAGWENVYCYWWGGSNDATACPAFPGVAAKLVAGTTDIYYAVIGDDATGFNFSNGKAGTDGGEQTNSMSAFEPGKLLKIDLSSKYEKNGGYRYAAEYVDLNAYLNSANATVGDVNGDGYVSITDATVLQKYVAGLTQLDSTQLISADTDFSGDISIQDVTKIQKYISSVITEW